MNIMNLSYWLIKVKSFSKQCVNKDTINTVLNIFHLFRFFTYWNEWSFPWRKNILTAVYCCFLCVTDCFGTLVSTVLHLMQTKSKSFQISMERESALLVCDGWRHKAKPVTTVGKKIYSALRKAHIFESFVPHTLVHCFAISFLQTLPESTSSAIE